MPDPACRGSADSPHSASRTLRTAHKQSGSVRIAPSRASARPAQFQTPNIHASCPVDSSPAASRGSKAFGSVDEARSTHCKHVRKQAATGSIIRRVKKIVTYTARMFQLGGCSTFSQAFSVIDLKEWNL